MTSATKIVFLMFAATLCVAFLWCVFTGSIKLDAKDFTVPVGGVLGYYFTQSQIKKTDNQEKEIK